MNDLKIFKNPEFGAVRTIVINNEPWFVGNDVAKSLGYAKPYEAIKTNVSEEDTILTGIPDANNHTQQICQIAGISVFMAAIEVGSMLLLGELK